MNRNKRMLKTTIIYFIGTFSSKLLTFLLLPLYANNLSLQQYGVVNLITNIVPLIGPIVTLQITESIFRFLCNCKSDQERKAHITNSLFVLIIGIVSFVILYFPICIVTKFQYTFLFLVYFVFNYFATYMQQILRGLKLNFDYAITGFAATLIQLALNVILISSIKERSILLAAFIASFCISLYSFFKSKIYRYIDLKLISSKIIKSHFAYSLPLIPNQISWWFNGMAGLYMIEFFVNTSATGLISFANKFPTILAVINTIYLLAWTENSFYEYESDDHDKYYSDNFNGFAVVQILVTALLLFVVKVYITITISNDFLGSINLIPFLFIAMIFNNFAAFLGTIYMASMNTKEAFKSTIIAAIINIILCFMAIPMFGIYGYVLANIISYIILFTIRIRTINKFSNIKVNYYEMIMPTILLASSIIIFYFFGIIGNIIGLFLISIFLIIYYRKLLIKAIFKLKIYLKRGR